MQRFFTKPENISGDKIKINDITQIHHLKDVLRIKSGQCVTVCDGLGKEYYAQVGEFSAQKVILQIKESKQSPISHIAITVACAIPKNAKFDDIIDKLTQLGVDRIVPLITERVIVKLDKSKKAARQLRWQKIAQSASEQSQRPFLPIVETVQTLPEVLQKAFDLKLIPTLGVERKSLQEALDAAKPKSILVLIGPEGDFTDAELALAMRAGCIPVTLGDTVLRVDTAAIAVVSFIKLYENR